MRAWFKSIPRRTCPAFGRGSDGVAVSALTGAGIKSLLELVTERGRAVLPAEEFDRAQPAPGRELEAAEQALTDAATASDLVIVAENFVLRARRSIA